MLQTMFLEPKHALRCITVVVFRFDFESETEYRTGMSVLQ